LVLLTFNLLIGLLAGLFGGLLGVGGGVVMIPLMMHTYKMVQHQAHGTSLVALVFTGIAGAITYYLEGSIDLLASILLASSAICTAWLGAFYAHSLPEWKLKRAFGVFIILVSILLLSKPYLSHLYHPITGGHRIAALLLSGMAAGFLAGMLGIGGGVIMVPAMVLLAGLNQHIAQGSSLLAMVPAGMVGGFTHWRLGNVVGKILPGLILGILIGTFLGGTLAHQLNDASLRTIFAIILIWQGMRDINNSIKLQRQPN
jgi:uncharacterized membrane protein YfcA